MAVIGFIGLGVMGEPMCRNLALKSGHSVLAYDLSPAPLERLATHGVKSAASIGAVADASDIVFLSLPSGRQVEAVCQAPEGFLARGRGGQIIADLGTTPVGLTRALAAECAKKDIAWADAPVARTREAAERGTLSIMVGTDSDAVFDRLHPLLACMASDITRCGGIGTGQVTKILNNMVLFQTVVALSEAMKLAEGAGTDPATLFETLTKGSADSFALRNHGMKAVLPGVFPERAFSAAYALKDLSYALELAEDQGVTLHGAKVAEALLTRAITAGEGEKYWPVIARFVGKER
jgi:3-hydroxyisobutyrate dehydrogenase-like beta-hydroxyacid dehydrogenase